MIRRLAPIILLALAGCPMENPRQLWIAPESEETLRLAGEAPDPF